VGIGRALHGLQDGGRRDVPQRRVHLQGVVVEHAHRQALAVLVDMLHDICWWYACALGVERQAVEVSVHPSLELLHQRAAVVVQGLDDEELGIAKIVLRLLRFWLESLKMGLVVADVLRGEFFMVHAVMEQPVQLPQLLVPAHDLGQLCSQT